MSVVVAKFASLAVGGDRTIRYRDALTALSEKYPAVKALLFFHVKNDRTVTYQSLDWSVIGDNSLTRTIADAIHGWSPGPK